MPSRRCQDCDEVITYVLHQLFGKFALKAGEDYKMINGLSNQDNTKFGTAKPIKLRSPKNESRGQLSAQIAKEKNDISCHFLHCEVFSGFHMITSEV